MTKNWREIGGVVHELTRTPSEVRIAHGKRNRRTLVAESAVYFEGGKRGKWIKREKVKLSVSRILSAMSRAQMGM